MPIKCLVKAPLNPYTGYGQDGLGIVRALVRAGVEVYLDPPVVSPPIPPDVAHLLTRRLEPPFDLLIHHVDPAQLGITPEAKRSAKISVGWSMWEYSTMDNCKRRHSLRRRLSTYDLMLGYDQVTTEALRPFATRTKLAVLQGGFWPEGWQFMRRDWTSDRFAFCMLGQLHQRKDPFVAINAFKELKDEFPHFAPAELNLKTNVPGLHSALENYVPGLRVFYEMWPHEVVQDFYRRQHILLAPSRGEGKNVPALEFMTTGGAVIATNWGGHTQWLSSAYAFPLGYHLEAESPALPECMSARASKQHLKTLMLHCFENRDIVEAKGRHASQIIPLMCHWDAVIERLFLKLADNVEQGGHLLAEYRRLRENNNQGATADV